MQSLVLRGALFSVGRHQRQHGSLLICCGLPMIARIRGQYFLSTSAKRKLQGAEDVTENAVTQTHNTEMTTHHSHLHILGSGSIGLMLAATIRARHAYYPLVLLLRDHHASRLVKEPIKGNSEESNPLVSSCINVSLKQYDSVATVRIPAKLVSQLGGVSIREDRQRGEKHGTNLPPLRKDKVELVLLTTKAFQAVEALKSIQSHLAPNCRIVVLCNGGLAVRDELMRYLSDIRNTPGNVEENRPTTKWNVELASITHGAYQVKSSSANDNAYYRIVHAGVGQLFLVESQQKETKDSTSSLLSPQMLEDAGLHPKIVSPQEMENILWYKLAANCVCNPLTAIHQCTNGFLQERVATFDTVLRKVVEEVCLVHRHYAKKTSKALIHGNGCHESVNSNNNVVDSTIEDDTSTATTFLDPVRVTNFVRQVIQDNVDNHSSMQQDVFNHRPTEIEFLNGYIVRMGLQYGINCPVNRELRDHVLALQATYPS